MNILLIDADSKIANLALMKLSTHHKAKGDRVELLRLDGKPFVYKDTHDLCYCSTIFSKHRNNVTGNCIYGGVGYNRENSLPDEIEHLMPDYSLYPENDWSIGYLTRGCVRKCSFCVVPQKEGNIHFNATLDEFYNPSLPKIMLLDNNILAYNHCIDIIHQLAETKKLVTFKQGMDFRLLNMKKAAALKKLRYHKEFIFALDGMEQFDYFAKEIPHYSEFFGSWRMKFYVLVGYNTSLQDDLRRVKLIFENKCLPYIMRHENYLSSPHKNFLTDLAAYCNQPQFLKSRSFASFVSARYKNQARITSSIDTWNSIMETL